MERLTEHHINKTLGAYMVCSMACIDDGFDCNDCEKLAEMVDRLAAYEDTGLEPDEINSVFIHDVIEENKRLKRLAQAEKDGRLEVLPPNAPLTLEELREMDGEPVWVEVFVKGIKSHWGIVHGNYISDGKLPNEKGKYLLLIGDTGGYDITWLAYRRKPEEGERL